MALPTRVSRTATADPFEVVQRDFDHLLGRLFNGSQTQDGGARLAPYGVDIREDGDHFYVEAELPGFKKDDVDITLENQTLTISAERSEQSNGGGGKDNKDGGVPTGELLLHERRYRRFLR